MAFDNKGAYWLQDSEEIANPYFGAAMLRCGEKAGELGKGKK
jgi:Cu(I)/Ag(I) efflux system membrane fusion protein